MPVNLKADAVNIVKKIGIKQPLFDWMVEVGITVNYDGSELTFSHNGMLGGTVPMTLTVVSQLQANTLHPVTKEALRTGVEGALNYLKDNMSGPAKALGVKPGAPKQLGAMALLNKNAKGLADPLKMSKAELEQLVASDTAAAQSSASSSDVKHVIHEKPVIKTVVKQAPFSVNWPLFPQEEMPSAPLVELAEADRMYQPVSATTAGSRYFLVAGAKDLKLAARYLENKLSIRAEGDIKKYKAQLTDAGMSSNADQYASMHVSCENDVIARRVLGAVITGLGVQFETLIPDLSVIKQAGAA